MDIRNSISLERKVMKAKRLINFTLTAFGSDKTIEIAESEGSIVFGIIQEKNVFVVTLKGNIAENKKWNTELQSEILRVLKNNFDLHLEKEWGECIQVQLA